MTKTSEGDNFKICVPIVKFKIVNWSRSFNSNVATVGFNVNANVKLMMARLLSSKYLD